jgi:hypothetical protein
MVFRFVVQNVDILEWKFKKFTSIRNITCELKPIIQHHLRFLKKNPALLRGGTFYFTSFLDSRSETSCNP